MYMRRVRLINITDPHQTETGLRLASAWAETPGRDYVDGYRPTLVATSYVARVVLRGVVFLAGRRLVVLVSRHRIAWS